MHIVQFPLEIFNLFFDSRLPVKLFLVILLSGRGFLGNLGHFYKFIDGILNEAIPFLPRICRQDLIFFFCTEIQIICERAGQIVKVFPLQDITSGPDAPLIPLDKFQKSSPEF